MKKIIFASALAALTACTASKPANNANSTAPTDVRAPKSDAAFFSMIGKKASFEQVKISSRIDVQTGSYVPTADATIYIENGKKVWMNIAAMFLNVARGVATPQGIKGYEKLGKTYIESDFTYLNRLLNVNFINYDSFQNLLLGRTFIPVNSEDFELTENAQGYTLTSKKAQKVSAQGKSSAYNATLNYAKNTDLSGVILKDENSANGLEISYTNWAEFGGSRFPQNVKIILKGDKSGQILIENTKFDFSKMDTPYAVPDSYKKKDIK